MSQSVNLNLTGIYTHPNPLSSVPDGSLLNASNIIIDRQSVAEPRRGFKQYGTAFPLDSDRAKQLFSYKDILLRHYGTKLQYDSSASPGTFTEFTATITEPEAGLRLKGIEANGNFYMAAGNGVKKISAKTPTDFSASSLVDAGVVRAIDMTASIDFSSGGFLLGGNQVGYKIVFGYYDNNNNLILGAPSSRIVVTNNTSTVGKVILNIAVPVGVNQATYIYQIYRTGIFPNSIDPGSDFFLVLDGNVSDLSPTYQLTDEVPDSFRALGAGLYTNSGQSDQANYLPPIAKDICRYKDYTFYANTKTVQNLTLSVLSASGITSSDTLTITDGTTTNIYGFQGTTSSYDLAFSGTLSNYYNSVAGPAKYFTIFSANNQTTYYIWYWATDLDQDPQISGAIGIKVDISKLIPNTTEVAISVGSPSFVTFDSHQYAEGSLFQFTSGLLPGGLSLLTNYYVRNPISNGFNLSSTPSGSLISTTAVGTPVTAYTVKNPMSCSISSPAVPTIITSVGHGLSNNTSIVFVDGEVPAPLALDTVYWVKNVTTDTFEISLVMGGVSINTVGITPTVATYGRARRSCLLNLSDPGFVSYFQSTPINGPGIYVNGDQIYIYDVSWAPPAKPLPFGLEEQTIYVARNCTNVDPGANSFNVSASLTSALIQFQGRADFDRVGTVEEIVSATNEAILAATSDFNIILPTSLTMTISCSNNGPITGTPTSFAQITITPNSGLGEDIPNKKIFLPRIPTGNENGPSASQQITQLAKSIIRVVDANTSDIVYAFYLSTPETLDGEILFQQRSITGATFTISSTVPNNFSPSLSQASAQEITPNRIYFSKYQQPEAVPLVNYIDIGAKDREIKRILALRDSLFIFKEDAIYRLTGEVAPFTVALFNSSAQILAPDTLSILNNTIFALSTQGIITVSDTGVSIISRPIENQILSITNDTTSYKTTSFAIGYETDRSYLLFTITKPTDTVATQVLRFNTLTQAWTRWTISKTCAVLNFYDNRLYLGASDVNLIEQERKTLTTEDYADRQYDLFIDDNAYINGQIRLTPNLQYLDVGDVIRQTQYLTAAQFNRVLNTLDTEIAIPVHNYYNTLSAQIGDNLSLKITNLIDKLNIDLGGSYYLSIGMPTIPSWQTAFNFLVLQLNSDQRFYNTQYVASSGTTTYQAVVQSISNVNQTALLVESLPLLYGPVTYYKAIPIEVIWNPQTFSDVSFDKQVREAQIMFENTNFSLSSIAFATDKSPSFVEIPVTMNGNGEWGLFGWSQVNWGGVNSSIPIRTYIPRDKQRCRYMYIKFNHCVAFEKISLFGLSLTFRPYNIRVSR